MKPCNYKGWSPDVNLISCQPALFIHPPAHCGDHRIRATSYRPHLAFDPAPIRFIPNYIGRKQQGSCDRALMLLKSPKFAGFEPAFWRQKDKYEDQHAEHVPLPRCTLITPQEHAFNTIQHQSTWLRLCPVQFLSKMSAMSMSEIPSARRSGVNPHICTEVVGSTIRPSRICTMRRHMAAASGL